LEAKNSGMVMAWPIPMSRSRVRTSPAMVIDSEAKNDDPSIRVMTAPSRPSGRQTNRTPRKEASTSTTSTWLTARTPAAKALPATSAARGVGVASSWPGCRNRAPR
jgi:hypothetical protein